MSTLYPSAPTDWSRTRLRFTIDGSQNGTWGGEPGSSEVDVICVRVADFDWNRLQVSLEDPTVRSIEARQLSKLQLRKGDILLEKSGGGERTPVGRVVRWKSVDTAAVTSNFVARMRPAPHISSRFLTYLFASLYLSGFSHQFIKQNTGIQNLDDASLLDSSVYLPDLATQKALADFLDHETARIDQLIEKKQQLQQLLRERQSAYLDQLTFGHEGRADWDEIPFKWICVIPGGQVDPTLGKWADSPLIAPNHIESETGRLLALESARDQGAISGKYFYPAKTVLYSKIRPALAKACIAPESGLCSADMYPIVPSRRLRPEYLLMQLLSRSFTDWATQESMRVAMPKINRDTLGRFLLVVPPLEVQAKLIASYTAERLGTGGLVDMIGLSITRLREQRTSLITAAVTGQLDISAWSKRGETERRIESVEAAV